MFKMKKKIFLGLFLILILVANMSFASYSTVQMSVVEEPVATSVAGTFVTGTDKRTVKFNTTDAAAAKVGDYVEVQGESKDLFKYTLIVYMIPFIFLILGIALGHVYFKSNGNSNYELLSFGVGVVFLFISALIVKYIDKKVAAKDASTIIMTRIL